MKLNFNRNQRVEILVKEYKGELASPIFVNDKLQLDTNGTFLGILTNVNYDKIEVEPLKAGFIYVVKAKANFGDTLQPTANGFVVGDGVLQVIRKINDEVVECIAVASSNGGGQQQPQQINFDAIFPVGSIYVSNDDAFDPNVTFGGTWVRVDSGRFLEAGDGTDGKTKRNAGLPNAEGTAQLLMVSNAKQSNACTLTGTGRMQLGITAGTNPVISDTVMINLNNGNRIYGSSNTVQPKSYVVNIWEKTALGGGAIPPAQGGGNANVDLTNYYKKAETDTKITDAVNNAKVELNASIDKKQNKLTAGQNVTINNDEISVTIPPAQNVDLTDYYNKIEVDAKVDTKQDKLVAGANITIQGNTISATGAGQAPDMTNYYTKAEIDGMLPPDTDTQYTAGNGLSLQGTEFSIDDTKVVTVDNLNTKVTELETKINAKANQADLDLKADKTAIPDVTTLATKDELNAKANAADLNTKADATALTALQNEFNTFKQNFAVNPANNSLIWTEAEYNAAQKEDKIYMIKNN